MPTKKKPARTRAKRLTLANLSTAFAALDARVRMTEIETKRLLDARHSDKLRSYAAMYGAGSERLAFMVGRAWGKTAAMHAAMGGDPAELTGSVKLDTPATVVVTRAKGSPVTVTDGVEVSIGVDPAPPALKPAPFELPRKGTIVTMLDHSGRKLGTMKIDSMQLDIETTDREWPPSFQVPRGSFTLSLTGTVINPVLAEPEPPFKLRDLVRVTSGRWQNYVGGVDWVGTSTYSQRPDFLSGDPVLGLILPPMLRRPGETPFKRRYVRAADCVKTTVEEEMQRFGKQLREKLDAR